MQQSPSFRDCSGARVDFQESLSAATLKGSRTPLDKLDIGLLPMDQMWKLMQLYTPPSTTTGGLGAHQSTERSGMETSPVTT
jgi:hypothetical protein